MLKYIGKRLLQTLLVLFIVSIFAFALIHLAGGNPALLLLPDGASDEAIKAMEHQLGLDQPLYVQYFQYMAGVFQGDLGMSTAYKIPVADIIAERLSDDADIRKELRALYLRQIGRASCRERV